jgi:hypothetical protein
VIAEAAAPQTPRPPFDLLPGAQVQYGPRRGTVVEVRGNGFVPYDVLIRWDGVKYPEWSIYETLKRLYEQGEFKVLAPGRLSFFERLKRKLAAAGQ